MEAETRSAEQHERIRLVHEDAERRRQDWQEAMDQARPLHAENHRAQVLAAQVRGGQQAAAIWAYCDATQQGTSW